MEQCVLPVRQTRLIDEVMEFEMGFWYGWFCTKSSTMHIQGNLYVEVLNYREIIEYDDWDGEIKNHLQPERCVIFLVNHRDTALLVDFALGELNDVSLSRSGKSLSISYSFFDRKLGKAENLRVLFDLKTGLQR